MLSMSSAVVFKILALVVDRNGDIKADASI